MTNNQIEYQKLLETRRSNVANEGIKRETNAINRQEADTHIAQLDETIYHNRQSELLEAGRNAETARNNLANNIENHRTNTVNEQLRAQEIGSGLVKSIISAGSSLASAERSAEGREYAADRGYEAQIRGNESRERIAAQDRSSRETVSDRDRESRERIAAQDRESREKMQSKQIKHENAQMIEKTVTNQINQVAGFAQSILNAGLRGRK